MDFKSILNKVLKGLKWFFFSYIWLFILLFVVDIVTKQLVVNYFKTHTEPIVLIPTTNPEKPFLRINYTINEAAAFGFGLENAVANRVMYCVVAFIGLILIVGIYSWKYKSLNGFIKACLMLMAVGAVGNLVDRLFYSASFLSGAYYSTPNGGGVVDWIDFAVIWQFIFNIADSAVVIGTLMLIVYLIVDEVKEMRKKRALEVKETGGKVLSKEERSRLEEPAEVEKKAEETEPEVQAENSEK